MKPILIFLTALMYCTQLNAQSAEDSVKAAVNKLFEGMKSSNGAMVIAAFADSAVLQTITQNKEGKIFVRDEQVKEFGEFVGKQQVGAADERIIFETVKVDGPLAIIWAPYTFYYEGKMRHCGVNSFQMVRLNDQWKIQYLIDTRRRVGCE